jgi:AraC family transcriptional regulator, regulatory protein of adaptative response / methylated-DNA-[protein]-cysteine methyltransferase
MMISVAAASPSPDTRWIAVQARDARADGRFVYGVTSTGIYCRPSCPSRRPRNDRVAFFATPDAAERAGFRACLRCDPRADRSISAQKVDRARVWIETHPDLQPSLARLARVAGASPWHLQRTFKRLLGVTPAEYARARRTGRLKRELKRGPVTDAIYAAGFGSPSRVYEDAPGALGMTPRVYRAGGRGVQIRFTTISTRLGLMLVAATDRGLCRVALGDDLSALEQTLRDEFPAAEVRRDRAGLEPVASALRAAAAGQPIQTPLALDVRATAFQRRVWRALQSIPSGQTRTYTEVARQIGNPRSARAVARACATNPVALAVPCHRVVPISGGAGGYRWGIERKQKLLEGEARNAGR